MHFKFEFYQSDRYDDWNDFIQNCKNSHFMFHRDYIEYHAERFQDKSIIILDAQDKLKFVIPANIEGEILYSHQGLTFGGILMAPKTNAEEVLYLIKGLIEFLKQEKNIRKFIYKKMPQFYSTYPSHEDLYALFRAGASLIRRDITSTIKLDKRLPYSKGRKWSISKAKKLGLTITVTNDLSKFWDLLTEVLLKRHDVIPTHSLSEMVLLKNKFPDNIQCYEVWEGEKLVSGALLYITDTVVHTQYLANSVRGRQIFALDYLVDFLIARYTGVKSYFDFGISTEEQGKMLNCGLIAQKEAFGARGFVHDFYEVVI